MGLRSFGPGLRAAEVTGADPVQFRDLCQAVLGDDFMRDVCVAAMQIPQISTRYRRGIRLQKSNHYHVAEPSAEGRPVRIRVGSSFWSTSPLRFAWSREEQE